MAPTVEASKITNNLVPDSEYSYSIISTSLIYLKMTFAIMYAYMLSIFAGGASSQVYAALNDTVLAAELK